MHNKPILSKVNHYFSILTCALKIGFYRICTLVVNQQCQVNHVRLAVWKLSSQ